MRRRQFIVGLSAGALAAPFVAAAQRANLPVVGFLNSGSPNEYTHLVESFRRGLKEGGYVVDRDVSIEYRWADGRYERLPELARELVTRKVAVITATGGTGPALATKSATSTIPIVFTGGGDPVKQGLVASLSHPGANITGAVNLAVAVQGKRFQILRELLPRATTIAYLRNPNNPDSAFGEVQTAAQSARTTLAILDTTSDNDLDAAFATMKKRRMDGAFVSPDPFFMKNRNRLVELAAHHVVPASYPFREFPMAGGLLSYGPNIAETYRQAGLYTARVLKGARPADLPVIQATNIELVLNLKTAKKLGLSVSRDFLARVDEVIA